MYFRFRPAPRAKPPVATRQFPARDFLSISPPLHAAPDRVLNWVTTRVVASCENFWSRAWDPACRKFWWKQFPCFQFNQGEACNLTGLVPLAGKLLFKSGLGYFFACLTQFVYKTRELYVYVEQCRWQNFGYDFVNAKLFEYAEFILKKFLLLNYLKHLSCFFTLKNNVKIYDYPNLKK